MPFGPYKDFDDCVSKNGDKDDPKAYCAVIKRKIEGDNKGEHSALPGWVSIDMFKDGDNLMRTIDVFRVGTHTDSSGVTREWGIGDLRNMVTAFDAGVPGRVPIKIGHTSDAFNKSLAEKLGLPAEVLLGERGEGAASLGHIAKLYVEGEGDDARLRADVELSPPLSRLVDDKMFSDVSAEIFDHRSDGKGGDYGPVLSAVAVLGAERPAVKELVAFSTKVDGAVPDRVLMFRSFGAFDEHDPNEDCIKRHLDEGMNREDATAKCKESQMTQPGNFQALVEYSVTVRNTLTDDGISVQVMAETPDDAGEAALDQVDPDDAGDWVVTSVEPMGVAPIEDLQPVVMRQHRYRSPAAYREAIRAMTGTLLPADKIATVQAQAEHVMEGAIKDALLTGTVQRTGFSNTIRAAWDLVKGPAYDAFSESAGGVDAHGGHVASVILPPSIAKSEADAKKWLVDHTYKADDWVVTQLGPDWVMRPVVARLNPQYTYRQVDVGDGIKVVAGTSTIRSAQYAPRFQTRREGELDMVTELEIRKAMGVGPKDDLITAARKLKESSTFQESMASTVRSLDHDRRVMGYSEHTAKLTAIPGTPHELADKLAQVEERIGKPEADGLLKSWQGVQAAAERAGVLSSFSRSDVTNGNKPHAFEVLVKDAATADKTSIPVAMVKMARQQPRQFAEYNDAVAKKEHTPTI